MWGHRKRSKMKARTVPLLQSKAGAKYNTSLSLQHIAGIFTFFWKRHWSLQFLFFLQWATFTIIFQYTHQRPRDLQPCSQGSLPPVPRERESERARDPGWFWSRGSRTKLIPREESFVSQLFCLARFHCSQNDRKSKIDLLTLQLQLKFGKFLPKQNYHQIITREGIKNLHCRTLTDDTNH